MIAFHKSDEIEGVHVYEDHEDPTTFYLMPNVPRYRLDEEKKPVFKCITYRSPVDRPDGKKGGGVLIFDVELVVPDEVKEKIRKKLEERVSQKAPNLLALLATPNANAQKPTIKFGQLRPISNAKLWKPSVQLQIVSGNGTLVEKVQSPGMPSLFGNFMACFTVELTPEGIALAEQALQGRGGFVQVIYNLPMAVRMPPVKATFKFDAKKSVALFQAIRSGGGGECDGPTWRNESLVEKMTHSQSIKVDIEPGAVTDPKVIDHVRDFVLSSADEQIKNMLLPDFKSPSENGGGNNGGGQAQAPTSDNDERAKHDREIEQKVSNLDRQVMMERLIDFEKSYTESFVMEWDPVPQATLLNITSIPGVKWEDHAMMVDLDHPFFKQFNLNIKTSVDFQTLPVHSIDVSVEYTDGRGQKTVETKSLKSASDVFNQKWYLGNDNQKYRYWYTVNYKGQSEVYQILPQEATEKELTINAVGMLTVDIEPGDINFDEVRAAQILMRYDGANPPEEPFMMTKEKPIHRFQKLIGKSVDKPYKYKVKYIMKDGQEYQQAEWNTGNSSRLLIDDVWSTKKTITVVGMGDFDHTVEVAVIDLAYHDAANNYDAINEPLILDKENKRLTWEFPVVSETAGVVTYSGVITYQDGSAEEIPPTPANNNVVIIKPSKSSDVPGDLVVKVLPDDMGFGSEPEQVSRVIITLEYDGPLIEGNGKQDMIFRASDSESKTYAFKLKDKTKATYHWQGAFKLNNGKTKTVGPFQTEALTLTPQLPDAS
ncbi:MAG: hypothetical protein ABI977_07840 [Acidobacteriota bacterium]